MSKKNKKTPKQKSVTQEQLNEFREAFELFDTNHDGVISTKELGFLLRSLGENPTQQELMDMINEVDVDDNQTVSFSEFVKLMANKQQWTDDMDDTVREAFRVFDPDGQGHIRTQEVRLALRHLSDRKLNDEEIEEMMKMIDPDCDGKIDYQAFAELLYANGTTIFI